MRIKFNQCSCVGLFFLCNTAESTEKNMNAKRIYTTQSSQGNSLIFFWGKKVGMRDWREFKYYMDTNVYRRMRGGTAAFGM